MVIHQQTITSRLVNIPSTLQGVMGGDEPVGDVSYTLNRADHNLVFDGKIDDAVLKSLASDKGMITSLDQCKRIFQDPDGAIKKATHLLDEGAETVKVDLGTGDKWVVSKDEGVYRFKPGDDLMFDKNTVTLAGDHVAIRVGPSMVHDAANFEQKVVGKWNADSGTITCISEEVQRTVDLTKEAPPQRPQTPPGPPMASFEPWLQNGGAQATSGPVAEPTAAPAATPASPEVDAEIASHLKGEFGDSAIASVNDHRFQYVHGLLIQGLESMGSTESVMPRSLADSLGKGWREENDYGNKKFVLQNDPNGNKQEIICNTKGNYSELVSIWAEPGPFEGTAHIHRIKLDGMGNTTSEQFNAI